MLETGKLYRINYDPEPFHHIKWKSIAIPSKRDVLLFLDWEVRPWMPLHSNRTTESEAFLRGPFFEKRWTFDIVFKFLWRERIIEGVVSLPMPEYQQEVMPRSDDTSWYVTDAVAQKIWESWGNYLPDGFELFVQLDESAPKQSSVMLNE